MAWVTAHLFEVILAIIGIIWGVNNKEAIRTSPYAPWNWGKPKQPDGTVAVEADDSSPLHGLIGRLIGEISNLDIVKDVGEDVDDLRRTLDSAMISRLRHRVEELTDEAAKEKGYDALDTLALIVLVPRDLPADTEEK